MGKTKIKYYYVPEFDDETKQSEIVRDIEINEGNLSREQEFHLFRKFNFLKYKGRNEEATAVRNTIYQKNMGLIGASAKRINKFRMEKTFEDIFGELSVHIIGIINAFDFTKGTKFSTYFMFAARRKFQGPLCYRERKRDKVCPNNSDKVIKYLIDEGAFARDSRRQEAATFIAEIKDKIDMLPKNYRKVLLKIYYEYGGSLSDMARELGCSRNNISLIRNRALRLLRKILKIRLENNG